MKKGFVYLGLVATSLCALVSCSKKESAISYSDFMDALNSKNYTIRAVEDGYHSITQYYDKENKASLTENQYDDRIDKDYAFENDGKAVSVVYTNYTTTDSTYIMNENGEFKHFASTIFENVKNDFFLESDYAIETLFKEDNKKITSAGVVDIPKGMSDKKTAEVKNISVKKDKVTFELNVINVTDASNHAFDINDTYTAEIYDMGKTKVDITSSIIADVSKAIKAECLVTKDTKYDAAVLALSPEEFENCGFILGDSCDVKFSNGYKIEDVPYYNGYYVKNNSPIIVKYPGFNNVAVTYNNKGIWDYISLKDGDEVTITLNKRGKYLPVQEALGQVYSFDRSDYTSDIQFTNFRALSGGNLKDNLLYRGASPVDNSRGRAAYTDALLRENNIKFVVDLADGTSDMTSYIDAADFNSSYTKALYDNNNVALLSMSSAYQVADYKEKLVSGLKLIPDSEGAIYIHCMEGKDRTGFVCMLLEALAGATYEEMKADYMITYLNYYGVDATNTKDKYDAIVELYFDAFMCFIHNTDDINSIKNISFADDAANYLRDGGMTDAEITRLKNFITK